MPRAPLALLVIAALAGCAGHQESPNLETVPDPLFDDESGAIEGFVVDDQLEPLVNATVSIRETNHNTTTGHDGSFRFRFLQPGTYTVAATREHHAAAALKVVVFPAVAHPITLVLERLAQAKAYHATLLLRGHMACGANANGQALLLGNCGDTNHRVNFNVTFPRDWALVVSELDWKAAGFSTNPELRFSLAWNDAVAAANVIRTYATADASPAIKLVLRPDTLHPESAGGAFPAKTPPAGTPGPLEARVAKGTMRAANTPVGGLTLQLPLQLYHTTFYFQPHLNPASFSAIPDT